MEKSAACLICGELLAAARRATERHIAAIGRMQIASIRRETDIVDALAIVVREARIERERTIANYRHHFGLHRAERAGLSA